MIRSRNTFADILGRIDVPKDPDACWIWPGAESHGYGLVRMGVGNPIRVHRLVYTELVGPIPDGLHLDHLCRQTMCCNPRHLEPVTNQVNVLRGLKGFAIRTHCQHGHPLDTPSAIVQDRNGKRRCAECVRGYRARDNARRKALRRADTTTVPELEEEDA